MLLELCLLEEDKDQIDPPTLRLLAPLYRQGPGYTVQPGCQLHNGDDVARDPLLLLLLRGACYFIK
jgi:hypothetical protein